MGECHDYASALRNPPTLPRARRCSTPPTVRSASPSPPNDCAPAASRRVGCPSSRSRTAASSAPYGCGRSRPDRPARRCCSGRSRSIRRSRSRGIGSALMRHALAGRCPARPSRRAAGRRRRLLRPLRLLGGENRRAVAAGPRRQHRLLGCELVAGAFDGARGRDPRTGASSPGGRSFRRSAALPARARRVARHPSNVVDAARKFRAACIPSVAFGG